jgi:hypothetical protein
MQHTDVGQIANLPRFRQVRNLPHVADFLRRAIWMFHWPIPVLVLRRINCTRAWADKRICLIVISRLPLGCQGSLLPVPWTSSA